MAIFKTQNLWNITATPPSHSHGINNIFLYRVTPFEPHFNFSRLDPFIGHEC